MKFFKNSLLLFVACGFLFIEFGCSKDRLPREVGFITDTGSYSNGGCEFIFETPSKKFKPRNLPQAFRVDGLAVIVTYSIHDAVVDCPNPAGFSGTIQIHQIEKLIP